MQLKHPNIVGLIEVCKSNEFYCIVLDYVPGVTLLDAVRAQKKLSEDESKLVAKQLIGAITYMASFTFYFF